MKFLNPEKLQQINGGCSHRYIMGCAMDLQSVNSGNGNFPMCYSICYEAYAVANCGFWESIW